LQAGDVVLFCLESGQYRPAMVVRAWTPNCASLQVFPDKVNDGPDPLNRDWFRASAPAGIGPGTWCERVAPAPIQVWTTPAIPDGSNGFSIPAVPGAYVVTCAPGGSVVVRPNATEIT
jgi:hypothetical protein